MYIPRHFAVTDREVLDRVIRENGFATLVSCGAEEPFATHVPLLLDGEVLIGHMAKANSHWKLFDGRPALAIFAGPHAYVSPRIYVSSPNVPTWNYITVHAYGRPEILSEEDALDVLRKSLDLYDPKLPRTAELDAYTLKQLPGIVAFRMPIERLEGKFKLNQNKQAQDRDAVVSRFSQSDDPAELAVAGAMKDLYSTDNRHRD